MFSEWVCARQEDYDKVASEDVGACTDFLRKIIALVSGVRGVTFSLCMPSVVWTRRRQQQKEETVLLVVRSLRRPIRLGAVYW